MLSGPDERAEMIEQSELSSDLLEGADEIAEFMGLESKRRVYHLCESGSLPIFRLGRIICARKSTLLSHIKAQEKQADHFPPEPETV